MNAIEKNGSFTQNKLPDMGYDLFTPGHTITRYASLLLKYVANPDNRCQHLIADIKITLVAGEQLLTLIKALSSQENAHSDGIDLKVFTSTVCHDLRTPLSTIIGYGEMSIEDINEKMHPQANIYLKKLLTSTRELLTLIDDLSYLYKKRFQDIELKQNNTTPPPPTTSPINKSSPSSLTTLPFSESSLNLNLQSAPILIVDDKSDNRIILSRRLINQGFEVKEAENGRQALQMVRNQTFDLILLDIMMPEMDGYQVLEALKKNKEHCTIPIIMISAVSEIDSVVRCIEMGAEDYLQKPFKQVILNAKIFASLERKHLRDREQAFLRTLQTEQQKSERLLLSILPEPIAKRLKKKMNKNFQEDIPTIVDKFEEVTVLFSDIADFTSWSAGISPSKLVEKLNQIFSAFDQLTKKYGLEKIKTIGDAYMLVGGLPTPRPDHAQAVANISLDILREIKQLNDKNHENLQIRIGIHTGPVVAGVIGKNKFNYDLWGDTVNIASRMESQGLPNCIQVSETTYQYLKNDFIFEPRAPLKVKGKGMMITYFLKGRK